MASTAVSVYMWHVPTSAGVRVGMLRCRVAGNTV